MLKLRLNRLKKILKGQKKAHSHGGKRNRSTFSRREKPRGVFSTAKKWKTGLRGVVGWVFDEVERAARLLGGEHTPKSTEKSRENKSKTISTETELSSVEVGRKILSLSVHCALIFEKTL